MRELLQEIVSLSPLLSYVEASGSAERKPSFQITRPGMDIGIHFAAIPLGHEFTSLVLALLQTGGHPPKVSEEVLAQIRDLDGEFNFVTYISLSCQNCPEVVQSLNLMALINPKIRHITVDGALFQDEVTQRQIMAVPTILLNDKEFGQGRMELEQILAKVDAGAEARAAAKIASKEAFDVLVVGGGPAGAAAAVYEIGRASCRERV